MAADVTAQETPLKDLAAAKGMRFGTAAGLENSIHQPQVAALIARECSIVVPENELKMYVTHNTNATRAGIIISAPATKSCSFVRRPPYRQRARP